MALRILAAVLAAAAAAVIALPGECPAEEKAVYPASLPPGLQKGREEGEFESTRDGAVMVYIAEGEFEVGSDNADEDEAPRHKVGVSAFFIDKFEVTNEQYGKFLEWWRKAPPAQKKAYSHKDEPAELDHTPAFWQKPKEPPREGEDKSPAEAPSGGAAREEPVPEDPVTGVTWYSAFAYAGWAGKSLPTEVQWEKAAGYDRRTKTVFKYPWGMQKPDFTLLNFLGNVRKPTRVGTYRTGVSPSGCHDMAGNVWEWCLDFYHKDFYKSKAGSTADPVNHFPSPCRVTRGGSYNSDETEVRCAYRDRTRPGESFKDLGFRCVKNVPPPGGEGGGSGN